MARPKKNHIQLSDADVKQLKSLIKSKNTNQTAINRCRVIFALDESHPPAMSYCPILSTEPEMQDTLICHSSQL